MKERGRTMVTETGSSRVIMVGSEDPDSIFPSSQDRSIIWFKQVKRKSKEERSEAYP